MILISLVFVICASSVISTKFSDTLPRRVESPLRREVTRDSYLYNQSHVSDPVQSEVLLTAPEIIAKYGYPVEEHIVQTEDGYLLTHFRIPHGHEGLKEKRGPPVIVQHGIFTTSDQWILMGEKKSLGFILADAGYDVWLTNIRGNRYSRKHITLSTKSKKFWDFSWHEMGCYDLPATIDYILAKTQEEKVYYIGHSMGNTMLFVMISMKPEYNDKIRLEMGLAPVAYLRNHTHHIVNAIVQEIRGIENFLESSKIWELFPYDKNMATLIGTLCCKENPLQFLCILGYNLIFGEDTVQLNKTLLPVYMAHILFGGASVKTLLHYAQVIKSGEFRQFDYGPTKNIQLYKQNIPPEYELEKITVPISIYYGNADLLTSVESINLLSKRLPNVVSKVRVRHAKFNHMDFVLANDGKSLVFDRILEIMKAY